jgi:CRISPR-associated protein Cas1
MMVDAGVMLGFCGSDGTPLFSATEVEWLSPQSEYRPTEYVQRWLSFWFDGTKRLKIGKFFQRQRVDYLIRVWKKAASISQSGMDADAIQPAILAFQTDIESSGQVQALLAAEGRFAKQLYKYAANQTGDPEFVRDPQATDTANRFLSHGNYLAYGLAATCLWCLGIPHGFAVMHGKTRRGALVFDVADLVKDAVILPLAFIASQQGLSQKEFREACIVLLNEVEALEFMFATVKSAAALGETLQ